MLFCSAGAAADRAMITIGSCLAGIAAVFQTFVNDTYFTATGAGGGDFFMTVVALANGLTADKAGVVVATVTAITATTCTFKMVSVSGFADIVAAGKCFVGGTDCAAGGTSVFPTFVMASLAEQFATMVAGHMFFFTCVTNEVHATRALLVVTYLTGVVVTFQQIVVAFEEVTAAMGAFLCCRGVGVVIAVADIAVAMGAFVGGTDECAIAEGAYHYYGSMVMVIAVAVVAVAIGAFVGAFIDKGAATARAYVSGNVVMVIAIAVVAAAIGALVMHVAFAGVVLTAFH